MQLASHNPFKMKYLLETLALRAFSLFKIPLLFAISPSVIERTDQRCVIRVPLNRRNRNNLNSMYFGALCIGADCLGGFMAMQLIRQGGKKINLVFKDVKADFLRRPTSAVYFACEDGLKIKELIQKADDSGKRENLPLKVVASFYADGAEQVAANFVLTLSLKKQSMRK